MQKESLIEILKKTGHLRQMSQNNMVLCYWPERPLEFHNFGSGDLISAKNNWGLMEPEDLPLWLAKHHVGYPGTDSYAVSSYGDDLVTLAAQAYMEGVLA